MPTGTYQQPNLFVLGTKTNNTAPFEAAGQNALVKLLTSGHEIAPLPQAISSRNFLFQEDGARYRVQDEVRACLGVGRLISHVVYCPQGSARVIFCCAE